MREYAQISGKELENRGSSLPSSASQEAGPMIDKTKKTKRRAVRRNVGEIILRGRSGRSATTTCEACRRFESTHESTDREDAEKLLRKRLTREGRRRVNQRRRSAS